MLSVVILTHNDDEHIERCLESVKWCDEIIVIDDNSTDKTARIAGRTGATVLFHKLNNDFSEQRNFGLAKAQGDWVLFIDSDEVVSTGLSREIKEAMRRTDNPYSGYWLSRRDWWGGRWLIHGETSKVQLLRLAKTNMGKWVRTIHEQWQVNGQIGILTEPILHYPHPNVAQFLKEINHYSSINAELLHSRGIKEPSWYILGKPIAKFFVNYVWRLGFLDGTAGAIYAIMMSFHSFLTRAKLYSINAK